MFKKYPEPDLNVKSESKPDPEQIILDPLHYYCHSAIVKPDVLRNTFLHLGLFSTFIETENTIVRTQKYTVKIFVHIGRL